MFPTVFLLMLSAVLLALFVPLSIYAANRGEVLALETLAPLGLLVLANAVLIGLARVAKLNLRKFAVVLSVFWVGFFQFGMLKPVLLRTGLSDHLLGVLVILALLGIGALVWRIERVSDPLVGWFVLVFAASVSAYPLGVLAFDLTSEALGATRSSLFRTAPAPPDASVGEGPDIFYVLLDGYAGSDVLSADFGYDNEPFLQLLRDQGFVVMDRSRSNYAKTIHSLASAFNMDYLDLLVEEQGEDSTNALPIVHSIHDSRLNRTLRAAGYQVSVVLGSTHLLPKEPIASIDDVRSYTQSSQFALTAYGRTPLSAVLDLVLFDVDGKPWVPDSHEWVLEQGLDLASNDRRDFAFLHVLSPHEPYYFDERCNVVAEYRHQSWNNYEGPFDAYRAAYIGQLRCTNRLVERFLSELDTHRPKPIVVIQGDHGPSEIESNVLDREGIDEARFRSSILNAIRVPGAEHLPTTRDMTPVNNFRVVLGQLGLAPDEKLEDRSYSSSYERPYEFARW